MAVRDAVLARLRDASSAEAEASNSHRVRCMLPSSVAHLLHKQPRLVAAAVDAFVRRDTPDAASEITAAGHSIGRGTAHIMRGRGSCSGHSGPKDGRQSVAQVVRLTRLMYAQLRHVTYCPPSKLVTLLEPQNMNADSRLEKAITLGAQLSVGFERLM